MSLETQIRLVLENGEIITDPKKIQEITDSTNKVGHQNALEILTQTELKPEIITAAMLYIGKIEEFFPGVDEIISSISVYKNADIEISLGENRKGARNIYHFSIKTNTGPIIVKVIEPNTNTRTLASLNRRLENKTLHEEERISLETQRDSLLLEMKRKIIDQLNKQIDANQAQ